MADDLQVKIGAQVGPAVAGMEKVAGGVDEVAAAMKALAGPISDIASRFNTLAQRENEAAAAAKKAKDDAAAFASTFRGQMAGAAESARNFATNMNTAANSVLNLRNLVAGFALYKLGEMAVGVGRSFLTAGMDMEALNNRMRAAVGDQAIATESMKYVREQADRLGQKFQTTAESFAGFSASALRSGLTMAETRKVFTGVSEAAAALGLSNERTKLVFEALGQMASKGTVSMEELRQQLGESLPGALQIFAQSMGVSTQEFLKMVTAGKVLTPDLVKLGDEMHRQFGTRAVEASQNARGEINRLQNAFFELQAEVSNSGPMDAFTKALRDMREVVSDPEVQQGLKDMAGILVEIASAAVKAAAALGTFMAKANEKIEKGGDTIFGALFGKEGTDAIALARRAKASGLTMDQQKAVDSYKPGMFMGNTNGEGLGSAFADSTPSKVTVDNYSLAPKPKAPTSTSTKSRATEWQGELDAMLLSEKKFGEEAQIAELQYWQGKLATAKRGTSEYTTVVGKVYALESQARNRDIQETVASFNEKIQAAYGNYAEQIRIEDEKLAYLKKVYGEDAAAYKDAQREKHRMEQQHTRQVQEEQQKQQRAYFNGIMGVARTFNASIKGMITGTTTFRQAMFNLLGGLLEKFVEVIEGMAAKWIAGQLVQLAASQTTDAAKAASTTASTAASGAVQTAYQGKSILGSAATTYSGVFANMSPYLGPLAAIPAGAAAALVGAQAALLPSFAVGAWELPGDTMANVHKGEMIIPAGPAAQMRDFLKSQGSGGGGSGSDMGGGVTINIHATDAQSVARLLKKNGGVLAGALATQARNGSRNLRGMNG